MEIVDNNGHQHDVTGSGQGLYNTIAGSIGALGVLSGNNGGGILGGLFGNHGNNGCSDSQYVNRYEANQLIALAQKDSEIALLKADQSTDKKLVDVYSTLAANDNKMRDRIDSLQRELGEKITSERESRLLAEKEQAVFNQSMIGTTATIKAQVQQLNTIVDEITTNVVPSRKVCDTCGCCCNG